MCEFYDALWVPALGGLLFFSLVIGGVRLKYCAKGAPKWLTAVMFWGSGAVGLTLAFLMVGGFLCVGSPGELPGIIPN